MSAGLASHGLRRRHNDTATGTTIFNGTDNNTSLIALDLFSLFLAPVRGGAGPYLAFYFASQRHWSAGDIGLMLGTMALFFALFQIPAGMIIDKVGKQRLIGAIALGAIATSMLVMLYLPRQPISALPVVLMAEAVIGMACAFFTPVVASLSLALVGYDRLNLRISRNEVFCHIGNIITGVLLGFGMGRLGGDLILSLLICACLAGMLFVLFIQGRHLKNLAPQPNLQDLDTHRKINKQAHFLSGIKSLATTVGAKPFAICAAMFFFANAAMLPLMIQLISRQGQNASVRLPAALLLAEFVMIPVCAIAGKKANLGRKPLLLVSFLLLALRGICFSVIRDPNVLVGVQILDGISAGIFSLLLTLVVADLSKAKGNLNSMLCALMMILTSVNAFSDFICGSMASLFGFPVTFALMATVALGGGLIMFAAVPETAPGQVKP